MNKLFEKNYLMIKVSSPRILNLEQAEKIKRIFQEMIDNSLFEIKDGCAILHFDHDGNLRKIIIQRTLWGN